MDDWEKEYNDMYYLIQIDALNLYRRLCESQEEWETADVTDNLCGIVEEKFIDFRLKEYASDYRSLIRYIYTDILNYNPFNPKQIK